MPVMGWNFRLTNPLRSSRLEHFFCDSRTFCIPIRVPLRIKR